MKKPSNMARTAGVAAINDVINAKTSASKIELLKKAIENAEARLIIDAAIAEATGQPSMVPVLPYLHRRKPNGLRPSQVDYDLFGFMQRVQKIDTVGLNPEKLDSRLGSLIAPIHDGAADLFIAAVTGRLIEILGLDKEEIIAVLGVTEKKEIRKKTKI